MSTHPDQEDLSRREFIRLVALSGTAMLASHFLSACGARTAASPPVIVSSEEPQTSPAGTATTPSAASPDPSSTWTTPPPAPQEYLAEYAFCGGGCTLPEPRTGIGVPLMRALSLRASSREFRPDELPLQIISDLLWAAFGINRPGSGKRTAPSAYDVQDIHFYLTTAKGVFLYEPAGHSLLPILPDDLRAAAGAQAFVAAAPLNFVYVSDASRLAAAGITSSAEQLAFSWAHSGFIAQNVYLYCASEGLACVVRSTLDREELAARLQLTGTQHITLAQTVGVPC